MANGKPLACVPFGMFPQKRKGTPPKKKQTDTSSSKEQTFFPMDGVSEESACPEHSRPHIHESILFVVQKSIKLTSWGNGSLSQPLQGFIHPRWLFGISAINSILFNFKFSTSKCHFRFLDGFETTNYLESSRCCKFPSKNLPLKPAILFPTNKWYFPNVFQVDLVWNVGTKKVRLLFQSRNPSRCRPKKNSHQFLWMPTAVGHPDGTDENIENILEDSIISADQCLFKDPFKGDDVKSEYESDRSIGHVIVFVVKMFTDFPRRVGKPEVFGKKEILWHF